MKEQQLIKKCQKGDRKAFQSLYESYAPYVYTVCRRYNILDDNCADMMQEIFVEIFNSLNRFDESKGTFKTWIRTITVHKILAGRRKHRLQVVHLDEAYQGEQTENEAIANLSKEDLMKLMEGMPDGYRTIFNLYAIDGYSHQEIAELLNIKAETSRSQLLRAKNWLKKNLDFSTLEFKRS